jgi:hypothetical protein
VQRAAALQFDFLSACAEFDNRDSFAVVMLLTLLPIGVVWATS